MKIHKLQNSSVRKAQQEQRKQEEIGLAKKLRETSLPAPHPLPPAGETRDWQQLQKPKEEPAKPMIPAAKDRSTAGWLRARHKGAASFCMSQEFLRFEK